MPIWARDHKLWEEAKDNIMWQLRTNYIPPDKWSWVAKEYFRLGGRKK